MAYRIGIEDGAAGGDGAARNAPARHGAEGLKASTTKPTAPTMETASGIKATAVKTASGMKASASMETATHAAMEAAATASMVTTAPTTVQAATAAMEAAAATARRHNVGCKHSKCCSRQQRERDFAEHD